MTEPRRSRRSGPEGAAGDEAASEAVPSEPEGEIELDLFGRPYHRAAPFPVEKSGDPLGGHPIDEPVRFWWSRRRRSSTYEDGIPTAPIDDPAPVSRSMLSERATGVRSRYFPLPDEVVHTYLGSGEQVLHSDHPSFRAFVVEKFPFFGALILAGALLVVCLREDWTLPAQVLAIVMLALVVFLFFQRLGDRYTNYVITNVRMIRMSGIISRSIESIPWIRVTDLGFEQSALERILGYATLHIESANETMGLRRMRGIADPVTFNHHLMDMVVAKQGPTAPLGRRSEYNVLAVDKGLFGKRRRKEAEEQRRRLVLDDASPEAGIEPRPAASGEATEEVPLTGAAPGGGQTAASPGGPDVERERAGPRQTDLGDI